MSYLRACYSNKPTWFLVYTEDDMIQKELTLMSLLATYPSTLSETNFIDRKMSMHTQVTVERFCSGLGRLLFIVTSIATEVLHYLVFLKLRTWPNSAIFTNISRHSQIKRSARILEDFSILPRTFLRGENINKTFQR